MRLPDDLVTPCLVVDADRMAANIAAMAALATERGLALRPHAKTHKCLPIAAQQLAAGAQGLTVATVAEAEIFAAGGADDLFVAYPIWADAARGARLAALAERVALRVGVGSAEGAAALARAVPGLEVLVEIDSGHHRTGVAPADAGAVAGAAERAGLRVRGVFTFPGHSYAPGAPGAAAADEATALAAAAESLAAAGIEPAVRSGGSTPSAAHTGAGVTELRPGVYVFGDAQQLELGTIDEGGLALVAAGTVVSRAPGRVVLDAGSKVLGADRPAWTSGFGRVPGHPDARVVALSEHHATVTWPTGPPPELGEIVPVAPNHVCAAVNLAAELVVCRDGVVVDTWPVAARGANT
ncbi:D-TA family PLP-dependent enzyme [Sporichthya brevicatena]|uniref:D-TA family PLP-dependent enzyme n=1 Tax=Sporichthya brevicatena TaxID=171442 RepID=A0ABN1GVY9_9ACTN